MAHKCYAGKIKYVDTVLEVTKRLFDNINLDKIEYGTPVGREMEKLLKIPISNYNNGWYTTVPLRQHSCPSFDTTLSSPSNLSTKIPLL